MFAVPVTDQSARNWQNTHQPFQFKSYDSDGHKMTQFVPHNNSVKFLLPAAINLPSEKFRLRVAGAPVHGWQMAWYAMLRCGTVW
jgi:hypothetical protein